VHLTAAVLREGVCELTGDVLAQFRRPFKYYTDLKGIELDVRISVRQALDHCHHGIFCSGQLVSPVMLPSISLYMLPVYFYGARATRKSILDPTLFLPCSLYQRRSTSNLSRTALVATRTPCNKHTMINSQFSLVRFSSVALPKSRTHN